MSLDEANVDLAKQINELFQQQSNVLEQRYADSGQFSKAYMENLIRREC